MLPLDFHPKKRRGQIFLIDKNIITKIIKAISLNRGNIVLEIGPGQGILTEELANYAKKVIAVELDKKLYDYLQTLLKNFVNIELINKDILKFDIEKFLRNKKIKQKITLVGNIPYNITTPILEYIFENIRFLNTAYLMVQKEFALRLIAKPNTKDYSSISCFAQFHTNPSLLFTVKKTCFRPRPRVDSCFIKLEPKKSDYWSDSLSLKNKKWLFKIIRSAFNQRRKNILNSLSAILDKGKILSILLKLNIDWRKRAEDLSIQDFIKISNLCFDYFNSRHIIE
ncbi:MAG: ribosomal RNA small subunit methyltransferase A [Candidatus Omnitrophica bacterium]|nr:ribosomal RNA small subunit methyltransferase A [Candidatus Omnitrophota bacterium]